MSIVTFNYAQWAARYPTLASSVNAALAGAYFTEATLYLDNSDNSPIIDGSPGGQRSVLLNMITAHIATLNAIIAGQPPSGLVGRIGGATQGSVSVTLANDAPPSAARAWWMQTQPGAAFWQATNLYRRALYVPAPAYSGIPYGPNASPPPVQPLLAYGVPPWN